MRIFDTQWSDHNNVYVFGLRRNLLHILKNITIVSIIACRVRSCNCIIYVWLIVIDLHIDTEYWCDRGKWCKDSWSGDDVFKAIEWKYFKSLCCFYSGFTWELWGFKSKLNTKVLVQQIIHLKNEDRPVCVVFQQSVKQCIYYNRRCIITYVCLKATHPYVTNLIRKVSLYKCIINPKQIKVIQDVVSGKISVFCECSRFSKPRFSRVNIFDFLAAENDNPSPK